MYDDNNQIVKIINKTNVKIDNIQSNINEQFKLIMFDKNNKINSEKSEGSSSENENIFVKNFKNKERKVYNKTI